MALKVLAATGGGIRGLAHVGIIRAGISTGRLPVSDRNHFVSDYLGAICADSSASLIMALLCQEKSIYDTSDFLTEIPFSNFFVPTVLGLPLVPWSLRKTLMGVSKVSLYKLATWIDSLNLDPSRVTNLYVNSWDDIENKHTIFCTKKPAWAIEDDVLDTVWVENAFEKQGFGHVLTRSMCLPGLLADESKWCDGGIAGHPPIAFVPRDTSTLLLNLGYAGNIPKRTLGNTTPIEDALICYDVTAYACQRRLLRTFTDLIEIDPEIYDIDPTAFNLSTYDKAHLIARAESATTRQWQQIPVQF